MKVEYIRDMIRRELIVEFNFQDSNRVVLVPNKRRDCEWNIHVCLERSSDIVANPARYRLEAEEEEVLGAKVMKKLRRLLRSASSKYVKMLMIIEE